MAVVAALCAAVVLPACGGDESAAAARDLRRQEAGEDLRIKGVPEDGRLRGNVVELELSGAGLKIVEPDGDTSGSTGHYVVFVDREPVAVDARIPEEPDVIESWESPVTVTGFTAGSHQVSVVVADGAHRRIGRAPAEADFTVAGPTVDASAPERSPARKPVVVTVAAEDVVVAAPDGSAADGTGHLDVFVDREPTAPGRPVPTERGIIHADGQTIEVPDLGGGEHEIWVVLVKGDETPFDPMVADKVVVQVG